MTAALEQHAGAVERAAVTHVRHYVRSLDHTGAVVALLFFIASLTPSLLPRTWPVQGILSGITVAGGYGVGVVLFWIARHLGLPGPSAHVRRRVWRELWLVAAVVVPVTLWLSSGWQRDVARAMGMPAPGRHLYLGVFVIAALTAAGLVGVVRLFHDLAIILARRIGRYVPALVARSIAGVLAVALAAGLLTGVVYRGLVDLADSVYASADTGNYPGVRQPTSSLRSGSPASLARWSTLGIEGRRFVAAGPTAHEIATLTHRPAVTPIRVFAGLKSAATPQGEADLVVGELQRTHAADRAVLAVAFATGTGWTDPSMDDPLEYMYGGDTAIATMQYSFLPSWMSFLVDKSRARVAARTLFDTVHRYWAALPAGHRPKLVVFGESLGTYGASSAFTDLTDLTARTDAALLVGPPNSTGLWRRLTDARQPGSPERLPVYGDGTTVKFAATAHDLHNADGSLSDPRVVFLQHASDPIVWWSPKLIWHKPDWLKESYGPDVVSAIRWYPFVTFWEITCDLIASTSVPAGHGHEYGPEVITAWAALLHPPGWTDADTAALTRRGV